MKNVKLVCGIILVAVATMSSIVFADHGRGGRAGGHVGIGLYFGGPFPGYYYPPQYYPYPYAYYPPVITVPVQPQTYIEQAPSQAAPVAENYYWYHCDNPDGYYPYIKDCPNGWQKVAPAPPLSK